MAIQKHVEENIVDLFRTHIETVLDKAGVKGLTFEELQNKTNTNKWDLIKETFWNKNIKIGIAHQRFNCRCRGILKAQCTAKYYLKKHYEGKHRNYN